MCLTIADGTVPRLQDVCLCESRYSDCNAWRSAKNQRATVGDLVYSVDHDQVVPVPIAASSNVLRVAMSYHSYAR